MELFGLFGRGHTAAEDFLMSFEYPWEALKYLREFVGVYGKECGYAQICGGVYAHAGAAVSDTAHIEPPCVIGENAEIRHGAYIRGGVLIGRGCVVGNSTELKNCILSDGVQVPHFNYVGDSILGYRAHLGAGAVISNVRADGGKVCVTFGGKRYGTDMRKLGALVGDNAEVGCNAVLNPGTVLGVGCRVYPLACVRGEVPPRSIYKGGGTAVKII